MPDLISVTGSAKCPQCGHAEPQTVWCQWGVVPGPEYELGDSVVWLYEDGKVVAPFSIRVADGDKWQWNCGRPDYPNVMVFDARTAQGCGVTICPECGFQSEAVVVVVSDGRFFAIRSLTRSEVDHILGNPREVDPIVWTKNSPFLATLLPAFQTGNLDCSCRFRTPSLA